MKILMPLLAAALLCITGASCTKEEPANGASAQERSAAVRQLGVAVDLNNKATDFSSDFAALELIPHEDMQELKAMRAAALAEARKINIEAMNAEEPGFGNTVRDKFIKGLELWAEGDGQSDIIRAQLLLAQFGAEYDAVLAKKRRR